MTGVAAILRFELDLEEVEEDEIDSDADSS